MTGLVVDASIAMRWILLGVVPPAAEHVRSLLETEQRQVVAPPLFPWEVCNALVMAQNRSAVGGPYAAGWLRAERWLARVQIEPVAPASLRRTCELAMLYHLTAYDAAYLELARRYELPLATLDRKLQRAAEAEGVAAELQ